MKSLAWVMAAAVALTAAFLTGCSKSPTAPTGSTGDEAQVTSTLGLAASLVDDGLAEDESAVTASASYVPAGPAGVMAAITPFTWWRSITGETRTWSFAWADTDSTGHPQHCVATLVKHLTGSLIVVPVSPTDSTKADTTHVTKALDETLTRKALLAQVKIGSTRVWRVVMVTGAFRTTPSAVTHLQSLRLRTTSGVDTTITDPLQWFALRHVLAFGTSDTVTVTATTLRTDDAVYIHRWDWRHRLHDNGDGTYSFTWVTTPWSGWRAFGIQAMSHGSIYDDTLPYDSQAWHFPFRVVGEQPAVDYYPS